MKRKVYFSSILIFVLLISGYAICESGYIVRPFATEFLDSCSITVATESNGVVSAEIIVETFGDADKIGIVYARIQHRLSNGEWDNVKSVYNSYSTNTDTHDYLLSFKGEPGEQYRCVAQAFAEKDGKRETTSEVKSGVVIAHN